MSIISNSVNRSLSKEVVSSRKQKFRQQKLYNHQNQTGRTDD